MTTPSRKTSDAGAAWSVTAFMTRYDDFIFLKDTGAVDAGHALPILAFVQADTEFTGVEAELFMPLAEITDGELDLRLFADYVRGKLERGGDLPRMPPLRYGARFQYHDERMTAGIEATQHADQDDVAAFETATEGYLMLNADFVWRIATRDGLDLDLFGNGSNLADEDARKHTSFVKEVAPPRWFHSCGSGAYAHGPPSCRPRSLLRVGAVVADIRSFLRAMRMPKEAHKVAHFCSMKITQDVRNYAANVYST